MDCIFCKIAAGEIPSNKLYEDDLCVAFYDLSPQAPVHFLVVPREHISGTDKLNDQNCAVVGHIFSVIAKLTAQLGLDKGYRVVNNCGEDGGQTVGHLHFHVLGGRTLAWPPG
ncbi:histidine triad nucleotide-binding protein [Angelakisella massiliensis]|uniref:histidine triad nucleotide-binding protein n=1 Tax=Angelakisella massiliensis TaxID=1871018 RepID=UPI0008F91EA1|nr:histidine triad nucleotide-binding protein [Angelakisella massiliensis]